MPNFPPVDMAIAKPPDRFLGDPEPRRAIRNVLLSLADYDGSHDYAYCWGYAIFRTVYTEGSDEAFAEAIKRLGIYAKMALDDDILFKPLPNEEPNDPLPNQDVWNRCYHEIVEDPEKLANASVEDVGKYFDTWVKEHLRPVTGRRRPPNARFELCIMLDQESIDNILLMPEKPSSRDHDDVFDHWVKIVTDEDNPEEGGRLWFRVAILGYMWNLWFAWQDPDFMYEEVFWVSEEDGVWNHRPPPDGYCG
jgi:hypothetical protein